MKITNDRAMLTYIIGTTTSIGLTSFALAYLASESTLPFWLLWPLILYVLLLTSTGTAYLLARVVSYFEDPR